MAPIQAVLVSSPDADVVASLAATLRDHWPVRTATTARKTETSLDDTVTVVVFDPAFDSLSLDDLTAMVNEGSPDAQLLQFGTSPDRQAGGADAVLPDAADEERLRSTVGRLQRRARYSRLLSRFYSIARSRSDGTTPETSDDPSRELSDIKRELDELAAELDDEDLFDVALGKNGDQK